MPDSAIVHPSSVVEPGAVIGAGSVIGPFCHIGPSVVIGRNVKLSSHVSVTGVTTLGDNCRVYPHVALGEAPQNLSHKGGATTLSIGSGTTIREAATIHAGSDSSHGHTSVGENCFIMAYCHIAHDCVVGNNVIMANGATLAGHCEIGDNVNIGGLTAVLQFVRVGNNAFLAGMSGISGDVIPFGMAQGNLADLRGLNVVGMRRSGMSKDDIKKVREAYVTIFDRSRPLAENLETARRQFSDSPLSMRIIEFLSVRGKRYFVTPPVKGGDKDAGQAEE
ncbi:MAG: acyl-ACP--UDP-N-acetylglucosamine O-acyltransferase [Rhizobiaceae bacterium]|nr:acyl-ACP--UDP-N-acetylglucosamine O-acyltransferase [Rhizobiaceae bacterium]